MARLRADQAKLIRIKPPGSAKGSYFDLDVLRLLLEKCFKSEHVCPLNPQITEAVSTPGGLRQRLGQVFRKNLATPRCLIVDFSSEEASVHEYDTLCWHISEKIDEIKVDATKRFDVVIVAADVRRFMDSVILDSRLKESCRKKGVGLIVVALMPQPKAEVCHNAGRFSDEGIAKIDAIFQVMVQPSEQTAFTERKIRNGLDILFGHFELSSGDHKKHVSALISVERLLSDDEFLQFVLSDLQSILHKEDFYVVPFGIQGGYMEKFALALVNNETSRVTRFPDLRNLSGKSVVLLCDVLSQAYPLREHIEECVKCGTGRVITLGFAKYASFSMDGGVDTKCYVDLDYVEYESDPLVCPLCIQGAKLLSGEYFARFAEQVGEFDSYTFWELISDVRGGFTNGHWPSDRTGYHYLHRIRALPIIKKHGYTLAYRIRNMLVRAGILPGFIDKILCPEEPEPTTLAEPTARCLGLDNDSIVAIPRKYFRAITARDIPDELSSLIAERFGQDVLQRRNVLILDQAAHHFGTLAALGHLATFFDAKILAFAVLVNRLDPAIEVGDWLPQSHYVALYRFPWPPFKGDECPCGQRSVS